MFLKKFVMEKLEIKDYFINALILLLLFLLVGIVYVYSCTNTLSDKEYTEINNIYSEMNIVDNNIKSRFYLDFVIHFIDREIVLEELKHDTVRYGIIVSENAFEMLQKDYSLDTINGYLSRCNLEFEKFVDLKDVESIFEITQDYFLDFKDDVEGLTEYSEELNEIVNPVEETYSNIVQNRAVKIALVCILYVMILFWLNKKNFYLNLYRGVKNDFNHK